MKANEAIVQSNINAAGSPPLGNDVTNQMSSYSILEKDPVASEMEMFDVELVKDQQGLGITIAGYVCEKGMSSIYSFRPYLIYVLLISRRDFRNIH